MKTQREAALLFAVMLLAVTGTAAQTSESAPTSQRPVINGNFTDAVSGRGVFDGMISLSGFEVQNRAIVALGTLTGVLADSSGTPLGRVNQQVILPLTVVSATCDLLHLELSPADVDLLDRRVHLQRDVIGVTKGDGRAPTFGRLLCSTAGVVGSRAGVDAVAAALTQVFRGMASPK